MHLAPTTVDGCRSVILVGLELKTEVGRQSQAQRVSKRTSQWRRGLRAA